MIKISESDLNCELFTRNKENLVILLSLLEEEPVGVNDFYVKYHTTQIITCLLPTSIFKLQVEINLITFIVTI